MLPGSARDGRGRARRPAPQSDRPGRPEATRARNATEVGPPARTRRQVLCRRLPSMKITFDLAVRILISVRRPPCHGRRRPATHVLLMLTRCKDVGGRPAPAMTRGGLAHQREPAAQTRPKITPHPEVLPCAPAAQHHWRSWRPHHGTRPDSRTRSRHDPAGIPRLGRAAAVRPVRAYRRHRGRDGARADLPYSPQECGARCLAACHSRSRTGVMRGNRRRGNRSGGRQ